MESKKTSKLKSAHRDLKRCLAAYEPSIGDERSISFLALTKAFEVCLEYGWKELKADVEDRGLEAQSPKDAVREAARVGRIEDPELWIKAINARNLSVHNYFSLSEKDFVGLIEAFEKEIRALI